MTGAGRVVFVWRKLASAKWEDAWVERMKGFADRLAITQPANAKLLRIEIFQLKKTEADKLRRMFGGTIAVQKKIPQAALAKPRAPILVRGRLAVISSERERASVKRGTPVLLIPAGMAFGTGEHATTATCLRLLADVAHGLRGEKWEMLDLGCGSGILALAARVLGARRCLGADFDPHAVRTARENVRANAMGGATMRKLDVREWTPDRTWEVVAANIFSGLLIEIARKLAAATAPGGHLIFSGILRAQEAEVLAAFRRVDFTIKRVVRKGKWIAGLAQSRTATMGGRGLPRMAGVIQIGRA